MTKPGRFQIQFSVGIPVKILAVLLSLGSASSQAATGSSWSRQPSWASSDESRPASPHKSVHSTDLGGDVSPFIPGSNNLALDIGQVFLMGDLSSNFDDSLGTQLHYTYGVSDLFGFDSSLGYSEHSNGNYSMMTLLSGLRMNLSWYDKVVPYFVVGLGFYRPYYKNGNAFVKSATSTTSPGESISAVLFGVHIGPGVDLELTKNLYFGAAITYHNMFGSTKTLASGSELGIGGSYTSFFLHLGATF